MTDMLIELLAQERVRRMRAKHREAEMRRAWMTSAPTRSTFPRRFPRR